MHIEIIQTSEQLDSLSDEWNQLLSCCSASHVPFLRHEYISTWWKTLGGGEWQQGELFTLIGRNESDEIIGIAPMFISTNKDNQRALLLLGSIEISDYLDLIVSEDHLADFMDAIFNRLESESQTSWRIV